MREFVVAGLGLSLLLAWLYLAVFGVGQTFSPSSTTGYIAKLPAELSHIIFRTFLITGTVVLLVMGIGCLKRSTRRRAITLFLGRNAGKTTLWIGAGLCFLGTLSVFGACVSGATNPLTEFGTQAPPPITGAPIACAIAAGILMGTGAGILTVFWIVNYSLFKFSGIILNVACAFVIGVMINSLLGIWVPAPISGFATAALPIVAALLQMCLGSALFGSPYREMCCATGGQGAGDPVTDSHKKKRPGSTLRTVLIVCLSLVLLFFGGSIGIYSYVIHSTKDHVHTIAQIEAQRIKADAIVVLGASVYADGTPSPILADRLEVAADLYFAGAAPVIIVSGDNREAHYNESDAMKDYCVELGVPAQDIYVDHAGYDTYASIYRAHFTYGAQSLMVVTQAYHLYRALAIAQGLGVEAYGVAADKGMYDNQTMYSLREVFARDKDFFQALLKLPPEEPDQPIGL